MSTEATTTTATTTTTDTGAAAGAATGTSIADSTSMITAPEGGDKKPDAGGDAPPKTDASATADAKPYTITVPEQYAQFVDKTAIEGFTKLANEIGMTAEQANKVAAFDFERRAAEVKSQDEAVVKQSNAWFDAVKKDPDLGGEKLAATKANIQRAFAKFSDAATAKELVTLGMENHPGLVRMLAKVGAMLAEDSGSIGGGGAPKEQTREWLYSA